MEQYEYRNGPPAPRMVAELAMRHDALVKQLADAQATIAALQAEVHGLKRDAGLDCGDHSCLYAVTKTGMRTNGGCRCKPKRLKEDLERSRKACDELQSHLTQRTAELEAASKAIAEWRKEIDSVLDKLDDREGDVVALQAELERMRALIKALPKVEGEITVEQRGDEFVVMVGTLIWLKCYKTDEILINAIVALWQHRQGMEG